MCRTKFRSIITTLNDTEKEEERIPKKVNCRCMMFKKSRRMPGFVLLVLVLVLYNYSRSILLSW